MDVQTRYHYLVERPDKGTQELYIRDTGVRASTIWHDRYVSQMHPRAIAQDRDLPVADVPHQIGDHAGRADRFDRVGAGERMFDLQLLRPRVIAGGIAATGDSQRSTRCDHSSIANHGCRSGFSRSGMQNAPRSPRVMTRARRCSSSPSERDSARSYAGPARQSLLVQWFDHTPNSSTDGKT